MLQMTVPVHIRASTATQRIALFILGDDLVGLRKQTSTHRQ